MDIPPLEEIPGHKELTPNERAALLFQLGILIEEVSKNYELGLDVHVAIGRYLFPNDNWQTAKKKLVKMFTELDDIGQMIFQKDPLTQQWMLAIAWQKDMEK
jgi:hypothetical protein